MDIEEPSGKEGKYKLLLFPKKFEFLLFLKGFDNCLYLGKFSALEVSQEFRMKLLAKDKSDYCTDILKKGFCESIQGRGIFLCAAVKNHTLHVFLCFIVGKSDFDFHEIMKKFNLSTFKKKIGVYLIGSCGSISGEGTYVISQSYQADRGFLLRDNSFVPRKEKIGQPLTPSLHGIEFLPGAICYSSHFLNEADYMNSLPEIHGHKDYVYDMETYYFYNHCKDEGLEEYCSIRVVTDKVIKQKYQVAFNCLKIAQRLIKLKHLYGELETYFENGGNIETEEFSVFYCLLRKVDRLEKEFKFDLKVLESLSMHTFSSSQEQPPDFVIFSKKLVTDELEKQQNEALDACLNQWNKLSINNNKGSV